MAPSGEAQGLPVSDWGRGGVDVSSWDRESPDTDPSSSDMAGERSPLGVFKVSPSELILCDRDRFSASIPV